MQAPVQGDTVREGKARRAPEHLDRVFWTESAPDSHGRRGPGGGSTSRLATLLYWQPERIVVIERRLRCDHRLPVPAVWSSHLPLDVPPKCLPRTYGALESGRSTLDTLAAHESTTPDDRGIMSMDADGNGITLSHSDASQSHVGYVWRSLCDVRLVCGITQGVVSDHNPHFHPPRRGVLRRAWRRVDSVRRPIRPARPRTLLLHSRQHDSQHDRHTPRGAERLVTGTAMTRTSARSRTIGGRLRGIRAQPSQPSTRSTGCGSD